MKNLLKTRQNINLSHDFNCVQYEHCKEGKTESDDNETQVCKLND